MIGWGFADGGHVQLSPGIAESADLPTSTDELTQWALRLAAPLVRNLPGAARNETAIILGTTLGCLAADLEFDRSRRENPLFASPAAFARTLPSTLAAELSLKLALRGPVLTFSAGSTSTATALHRAASWMKHLNFAYCLAGGTDLTLSGTPRAALVMLCNPQTPGAMPLPPPTTDTDLSATEDKSLTTLIKQLLNQS